MSICFALDSALPLDLTIERISQTREKYWDTLRYFWISKVGEATAHKCEDDAEYGFVPKCTFLIQWNKEHYQAVEIRRIG